MPRDKIIYVVALELKMLYEENDNLCTLSRRRNHAATNQSKFECKVLESKHQKIFSSSTRGGNVFAVLPSMFP